MPLRTLLTALLISLFWLTQAQAETIIIKNDYGGNVLQYQAKRRQLAKADRVRIEGQCNSACTIFITLSNVCLDPNARIGFHGARPKTGLPPVDYFLDSQIGRYYRAGVRRQFDTKWRFLTGEHDLHFMRPDQLVKLDPKIKICKVAAKKKPKAQD